MRKPAFLFFLLSLVAPKFSAAQDDENIFAFHPDVRMNFCRMDLFAESIKNGTDTGWTREGKGAGLQTFFAIPYNDDADAPFRLGYSFACTIGYGQKHDNFGNESGHWFPYELDIGMWSSYQFHPQAEIGVQYLPIGIFGYSTYAFFGSSLSGRLRLWHLQFEATREADGIFRGCFVPKFQPHPLTHYSVLFLYNKYFFAGMRYVTLDLAEESSPTKNLTHELRIFIGFGPNF